MTVEKTIPKVIHYCWFGKGEKSNLSEKCIQSWKEKLEGYEIIEWNEENFNINCNKYVKEAYERKKYAFVSDYVRLYVLYNYGGIYLDTDVEVLKTFDQFLVNDSFVGFEDKELISTGALATIPVCVLGKIMGKKIIFIESFAKVTSQTLTGKLVYRFANQFYVQWEEMKKFYPNAIYKGGIY